MTRLAIKNEAGQLEHYEGDPGLWKYVRGLESKLEAYRTAIKHSFPEETGAFFICGHTKELDLNGMPTFIHVCPAMGLDWSIAYKRVK